jgi:hypothetical protein
MWTKSQKISAAVLALAATAFAVDRWVIGAPATATDDYSVAAADVAVASTSSALKTATAQPKAAVSAPLTLASRLAAIGEARRFSYEPAGDAFRPSERWLADAEAAKKPVTPEKHNAQATTHTARKADYAAIFRAAHKLDAVMSRQGGGMAIVDGKVYKPGQTLDGFKLTQVGDAEATFVGRATTVTLRLPGPAGAAGAGTSDAPAPTAAEVLSATER